MTVTLNLKPEVQAGLLARAEAMGLSLDQFLSRQLESLTQAALPPQPGAKAASGADQWEQELDAWLDSFPQRPILSDQAMKREDWYPDRW